MSKVVENYLENSCNPGIELAKMIKEELKSFSYVHEPTNAEFSPLMLTATYLSPAHKFLLTPDQVELAESFLRGKYDQSW